MDNIWTQFIVKKSSQDDSDDKSFVEQLKKFNRYDCCLDESTDNPHDGDTFQVSDRSTENNENEEIIMSWYCRSHRGFEQGLSDQPDDTVHLIKKGDGMLILRYLISGDNENGEENIEVSSRSEAEQLVEEDNETTMKLYPENSELLWVQEDK